MTEQKKKMNEVLKALLVLSAGVLTLALPIGVMLVHDIVTNPYNLASYEIESTACDKEVGDNVCTIVIVIKNNSSREFTPDFTGTAGPGFAESGIWGVYIVDSKGTKVEGSLSSEMYSGLNIATHETAKVSILVRLEPNVLPKKILIFDRTYGLSPRQNA
jgi:hypothetical protein